MKTINSRDYVMSLLPDDGGISLEHKHTKRKITINKLTPTQAIAIAADVFDLSFDDASTVVMESLGAAIVRDAVEKLLTEEKQK